MLCCYTYIHSDCVSSTLSITADCDLKQKTIAEEPTTDAEVLLWCWGDPARGQSTSIVCATVEFWIIEWHSHHGARAAALLLLLHSFAHCDFVTGASSSTAPAAATAAAAPENCCWETTDAAVLVWFSCWFSATVEFLVNGDQIQPELWLWMEEDDFVFFWTDSRQSVAAAVS